MTSALKARTTPVQPTEDSVVQHSVTVSASLHSKTQHSLTSALMAHTTPAQPTKESVFKQTFSVQQLDVQ